MGFLNIKIRYAALVYCFKMFHIYVFYSKGARGGAVGTGTSQQAGKSRVRLPMFSLEFCIDDSSGCTMVLRSTQPGIFPDGQRRPVRRLTTVSPSCTNCHEMCQTQNFGTLRACPDLHRDSCTAFLFYSKRHIYNQTVKCLITR